MGINMQYKIDAIIIINNVSWRIAGYSFRFGKEWQYTLQRETTDGEYKTIYLNEQTINELFSNEPQTSDPNEQIN